MEEIKSDQTQQKKENLQLQQQQQQQAQIIADKPEKQQQQQIATEEPDQACDIQNEQQVGITEFMCKGEPVKAIFKYRYTDFIVNEIDIQNKSIIFPKKEEPKIEEIKQEKFSEKEVEVAAIEKVLKSFENPTKKKEFEDIFGAEKTEDLMKFYSALSFGDKSNKFEFEINCPEDKQQRAKIHQFIRDNMPQFDSNTILNKMKIAISFVKSGQKKIRKPMRVLEFTMMKIGYDTFSALQQLSSYFHIPPKAFSTAGIKDKRGITTQKITVKTNLSTDEMIQRWSKSKTFQFVKIADPRVVSKMIKTGDLYGNRFSILMRLTEPCKEKLIQNIENAKIHGFVNYYGTQRFGNNTVKTHEVGIELLKLNWKSAFEKILSINYKDKQVGQVISNFLKNRNCEITLKRLPYRYRIERQIIDGLRRYGASSYQQAIQNIPKKNRELYLHAYQSYLWNRLASYRIQKFGRVLAIGDMVVKKRENLVIPKPEKQVQDTKADNNQEDEVDAEDQEQNKDQQNDDDVQNEEYEYQFIENDDIELITEKNISQYKIDDMVIPIFGSSVQIKPEYVLQKQILDFMKVDGINSEDFENAKKVFFIQGGYRMFKEKIENVEYKFLKFNSKDQDLQTPFYNVEKDLDDSQGSHEALSIRFSLKKGSYATVLLRELVKSDSSLENQLALNKLYDSSF